MFDAANQAIFAMLKAPETADSKVLELARFCVEILLYLAVLGLVLGWVWGRPQLRRAVFLGRLSVVLGLLVNWLIGAFWFHPRPFVAGIGHQFPAHLPETSFPGDHGTILFAIAFALLASAGARLWGLVALLLALVAAWGRIYLGVHWPLDMAGSALVALLCVILWLTVLRRPLAWLCSLWTRLYKGTCAVLHLPPALFPRA